MGGYTSLDVSVCSACSVGFLFSHRLHSEFYLPLISRIYRWFGCDVVPTEFTEFTEFGCVLLICEYQCHLWEDILRWTFLRVPRVLWAFFSPTTFTLSFTSHRFHSEFYLPQISRIYTDGLGAMWFPRNSRNSRNLGACS